MCFVIGPIGKAGSEERKHADFLLLGIIKPVLEGGEFGYTVKRADEDADPGMISDRMISDIINADLVVADLTGLNPNAFYELGIRHSAEKPVIHIAKAGTVLPFDNAPHRAIFVDVSDWHSGEDARSRLTKSARAIRQPGYRVSNPITQANASFIMRESADPHDQLLANAIERLTALESALSFRRSENVRKLEGDIRESVRETLEHELANHPEIDDATRRSMLHRLSELTLEDFLDSASAVRKITSPLTLTVTTALPGGG
jgi:hypothetical protein